MNFIPGYIPPPPICDECTEAAVDKAAVQVAIQVISAGAYATIPARLVPVVLDTVRRSGDTTPLHGGSFDPQYTGNDVVAGAVPDHVAVWLRRAP